MIVNGPKAELLPCSLSHHEHLGMICTHAQSTVVDSTGCLAGLTIFHPLVNVFCKELRMSDSVPSQTGPFILVVHVTSGRITCSAHVECTIHVCLSSLHLNDVDCLILL